MGKRPGKKKKTSFREELKARLPHRPLSLRMRILLWVVGWSVLLIGFAGLALPGIQGILTILLGVAILSLASETAYRLLRRLFRRWPGLWERIDRFRGRMHDWLHRRRSEDG